MRIWHVPICAEFTLGTSNYLRECYMRKCRLSC